MQFEKKLLRFICTIMSAEPLCGPVFMFKIDIADAYMRVWIHPKDLPHLTLFIPPQPLNTTTLIEFHLILPIGYLGSDPYFSYTSKKIMDLSNQRWDATVPEPLKEIADTQLSMYNNGHTGIILPHLDASLTAITVHISPNHHATLLCYVEIYVNNFILLSQG